MQSFPNCKLNLGLHILSKRNDGYHNIETVMVPVFLCDQLQYSEGIKDSLVVTGVKIDVMKMEENIIYKALQLCREIKEIPPLSMSLQKNIPSGAGLGGGSADASFMIKMLNENFELNLSEDEQCRIALLLGSDCPFFIKNRPTLVSGRGEILSSFEISLSSYQVVIVHPAIHVSTAYAYSQIKPNDKRISIREIVSMPIEKWRKNLINDFETTVFHSHPILKEIKNELYSYGAIYAAMSGSGSSVYGIFEHFSHGKPLFYEFPYHVVKFKDR